MCELRRCQTYIHFRASFARLQVCLGLSSHSRNWSYYDTVSNTSGSVPLICISGATTTAESFFFVHSALASSGFRVISIDYPPASSFREWAVNLVEFLDFLRIPTCHLFGCGLGGYLALWFAKTFPDRTSSVVILNSFVSTLEFYHNTMLRPLFSYMPGFILKRYVLDSFDSIPAEPRIADATDFVVTKLEKMPTSHLLSRMLLQTNPVQLENLEGIRQRDVLILQTLDKTSLNLQSYEELISRLNESKVAELKSGGDFPMLAYPDEIILHVRIHLRRYPITCVPCDSTVDKKRESTPVREDARTSPPVLFSMNRSASHPKILQTAPSIGLFHPTLSESTSVSSVVIKKKPNEERERRKKELFNAATSKTPLHKQVFDS